MILCYKYFYPRPLRGGRQGRFWLRCKRQNFYPRPLRGGRRWPGRLSDPARIISIHALCEEGDSQICSALIMMLYFYPRPLRGGRHDYFTSALPSPQFLSTPSARRATIYNQISNNAAIFLSTPSARRATFSRRTESFGKTDFYPRPLRGGRPGEIYKGGINI